VRPRLIAHRGLGFGHPENTLAAFAAALSHPAADGIECDVRLDAAGLARIFHDEDTERLTGVPGAFEAHPPEALAALRVGGEPVPTLAGLVEVVGARPRARATVVNVELKPTRYARALVAACAPALEALSAAPGVELVVSSFDPRVLAALESVQAGWGRALIFEDPLALNALKFLGPLDLHPRHDLVDVASRSAWGTPHRAWRAWTVNEVGEARRLAGLGVAGLITDDAVALAAGLEAGARGGGGSVGVA